MMRAGSEGMKPPADPSAFLEFTIEELFAAARVTEPSDAGALAAGGVTDQPPSWKVIELKTSAADPAAGPVRVDRFVARDSRHPLFVLTALDRSLSGRERVTI